MPAGAAIGGDYVAFFVAAHETANGRAPELYDAEIFEERLKTVGPAKDYYGLTWQYPPTYLLIVFPLTLFAFIPGYVFWTGVTAAGYFASLRAAGFGGFFLFVVIASPSAFHAVITGQNGFLTGALLGVAALYPDKRPVVAGLAAALLTVKPQLGLLLPIAWLAGGCWRAFFVAAFGALALALLSVAAFGAESWAAFIGGVTGAAGNVSSGLMPLYKMATPFAAAKLAGLPSAAAAGVQILAALAAAGAVALIWRRVRDAELRAMALIACVFFAAPYGYYYELIILALPLCLVARRAMAGGWLRYEQASLAAIFLLTLLLPGDKQTQGVSLAFVVAVLAAGILYRRIAHERPEAFRFASATFRPRSD